MKNSFVIVLTLNHFFPLVYCASQIARGFFARKQGFPIKNEFDLKHIFAGVFVFELSSELQFPGFIIAPHKIAAAKFNRFPFFHFPIFVIVFFSFFIFSSPLSRESVIGRGGTGWWWREQNTTTPLHTTTDLQSS
ncbi:hypothetical protein [Paenibacillus larvae]|uniref:hypothetical protein n=1 Tax=Paenibacillus larvae TaxID=1464 RepID=UPI0016625E6C|nr:hypothetical protein [Paenibacillus larvae]